MSCFHLRVQTASTRVTQWCRVATQHRQPAARNLEPESNRISDGLSGRKWVLQRRMTSLRNTPESCQSSPAFLDNLSRISTTNCSDSFRFGELELAQRTAHIGQRVPVLTGRTVLRWLRRLAGVGNRIPELSTGAIQRLCRTDPGAEERQGSNRSGRENGDGRRT